MSTKPQSYASLPQAAHILVEVVYGLITRDCRGMGICKLNSATSTLQTTNPCGSSYAIACITADGSFSLRFLKSSVSETQFQKRFASGIFQLQEAFQVPQKLFPGAIELAAKDYPIRITDEYIIVDFR